MLMPKRLIQRPLSCTKRDIRKGCIMQVLAAFLLYEVSKAERSFWHPYLLSLPRQYTCLSYFSQAEAEQLQVSNLTSWNCTSLCKTSLERKALNHNLNHILDLQVEDAKDLAFSVFEALRSSHKEVKAALCALGARQWQRGI